MDNYGTADASMGVTEDPLHQVLALERKAEGIVRDAQAEAERLTTTANERIATIARRSQDDIEQQTQELQEASDQTVESEALRIKDAADAAWQAWHKTASAHIQEAVDYAVAQVIGGDMA